MIPAFLLLAEAGQAVKAVQISLTPLPELRQMEVRMTLPAPSPAFHMPAWRPGDYQLFQYGATVASIEFQREGRPIKARKADGDTWTPERPADEVVYRVTESAGNFSPNLTVRPQEVWISGPVFGWFEGADKLPIKLALPDLPGGLTRLYTPLRQTSADLGSSAQAKDYDELIDSPLLLSNLAKSQSFQAGGRRHDFVAFGEGRRAGSLQLLDLPGYAALSSKIVYQGLEMFGGLPYESYVFFGDFAGGLGGLEHRASTRLGLGSPAIPAAQASLISHEFFHVFNVKQIRPKSVTPYDFTKPAVIESLWWLEGVTDYYADVLLVRSGIWTQQDILRSLGRALWGYENRSGRLARSAAEVSRRVWEERGSQGSGGVSYYEQGKVIGFLLDLAIRRETAGKRSLDDVMRALYLESTGGAPGYDEGRIRELLVKEGHLSLGAVYDKMVDAKGKFDLSPYLEPFGLARSSVSLVPSASSTAEQASRLEAWPFPAKSDGTLRQEQALWEQAGSRSGRFAAVASP